MREFLETRFPEILEALRIVKNRRYELGPPRITYALPQLHKAIKQRFNYANGTFFEVGANDGLSQSNTAYLERYLGWTGILVEPVPHKYIECRRNRPKSKVVHAALVADDYGLDYVKIKYSNLMSIVEVPGTLDPKMHSTAGGQFLGKDNLIGGDIFLAPARTVTAILEQSGVSDIDLFSIDVEGFELEVLKGINFNVHRPRHFIIEVRDLPTMTHWMANVGYRMEEELTHHDFLFADMNSRPSV